MTDHKHLEPQGGEPSQQQLASDPFSPENLAKLRLSQDFARMSEVKPVITTIAVRKPSKYDFVRVRPGLEFHFAADCFVDKEKEETFLVSPAMFDTMRADLTRSCLVVAIGRQSSIPFLWRLTVPDSDRPNSWNATAIEVARAAESQWVRCVSDRGAQQYVPHEAQGDLPEPVWPADLTMDDYIRLAFKDRFIDSVDHPVLRQLRGVI